MKYYEAKILTSLEALLLTEEQREDVLNICVTEETGEYSRETTVYTFLVLEERPIQELMQPQLGK